MATFRPLDTTLRVASNLTGISKVTEWTGGKIGQLIDRLTPESVKAGVVSDYGVPEAVIDARALLSASQRKLIRTTGTLIDKLSTLTRAESRVAYEWMNSQDPQSAEYFRQQLPAESLVVLS